MARGVTTMKVESSTAQAIMQAAVQLFYEQGYSVTSLRQISDAVGLQVGSLYNHISSKEQLLYSIMKRSMTQLLEDTETSVAAATDPVERLRAFMAAGIRFHAEHRHEALIGNSELRALSSPKRRAMITLRDRYQGMLERLLQEAADGGAIKVSDVKIAAYAGVAICVHVASWYQPGGRLALDDVEEGLAAMYSPTLGTSA
jgi:TetR/AcrR family transcriptional regulator, cholesterol catabolism regulator